MFVARMRNGSCETRFLAPTLALGCSFATLLSSCADRSIAGQLAIRGITPSSGRQQRTGRRRRPNGERSVHAPERGTETAAQQSGADNHDLFAEGGSSIKAAARLVFSKSGLTRSSRSGLYEDAILLARLRRALKETAEFPKASPPAPPFAMPGLFSKSTTACQQ